MPNSRTVLACILCLLLANAFYAQSENLSQKAESAMLKATKYMVEEVSTEGGYLRVYLPDFSRRWGELEAFDTQIWIQEYTPAMGNIFLDAYEITGTEYYYEAADKVARALIRTQLPCGGWNYLADFAGDQSIKEWYNTIGKYAWGFEEYNHYYGNATIDDGATADAAKFLLRIYLLKNDPVYRPGLDKTIHFFLESQYPLGGWPQRYPLMFEYAKYGKADYTSFYTFNDNVQNGSLDFLILCYSGLGREDLLDPILRAMNFYLLTQQGNPQGGWGMQYNMELQPAHARTYEPASLNPQYTFENCMQLMKFYKYTGDRKYLARIPDAIGWLERSRLPEKIIETEGRTHAFALDPESNTPLYPHRSGSGVSDGHYWIDNDDTNAYAYGYNTRIDIELLKQEYTKVASMSPEEAIRCSPLRFRGVKDGHSACPTDKDGAHSAVKTEALRSIINSLDKKGRWLSKHEWVSDPYHVEKGSANNTALHSEKISANGIVDASGQEYLSTGLYRKNMTLLLAYLSQ